MEGDVPDEHILFSLLLCLGQWSMTMMVESMNVWVTQTEGTKESREMFWMWACWKQEIAVA